jgi:peptide/nickel transport system substrate-binding protein
MKRMLLASLCLAALAAAPPARAADLNIAFADPVSALDPQLNNYAGDRSADLFFWNFLATITETGLRHDLALSWKPLDNTTWEFKLRPGVTWHDGVPFTSDDVAFSYARARNVPGSAATFAGYLRTVASVETPDPLTVIIHTNGPAPNLPRDLASVHLVSRHVAERATNEDYITGRAVVGTGPYRFVSYVPGDRLVARRNDTSWEGRAPWDNVTFHYMASAPARTAALLAGDADVIDKVSVSDIARLKSTPSVRLFAYRGLRVMLLQPNFSQATSPLVTDNAGKPLTPNPLLNLKVRQALDLAINRDAIADRILQGGATVANQWMPQDTIGYNAELKDIPYAPDQAKKLLAEAGYPDGFNLVLHAPGDRYPLAPEVAQAIGQFWTRIGVKTKVEAVPGPVYLSQAPKGAYAVSMIAWGNGTGEASYAMVNIYATVDLAHGFGASNWGFYSNKRLDELTNLVAKEFDEGKQQAMMREAAVIVRADAGVLPLFHYQNVWAARKGLVVKPLTSDRTAPQMITPE